MKKIILLTLAFGALISSILITSCSLDKCDAVTTYTRWDPIIMTQSEIANQEMSFIAGDEVSLKNPGKIYYYNNHLFINEFQEGIHIYNNTDASNPVKIGFIEIPGNQDIAVKNGVLYADHYTELFTINISDISQPVFLSRFAEIFTYSNQGNGAFLVGYRETEITEDIPCDDYRYGSQYYRKDGGAIFAQDDAVDFGGAPELFSNGSSSSGSGVGGSMASFTIVGNYLYVIDETNMDIFDVTDATIPAFVKVQELGWQIETIFPYEDYLFIGSQAGMFIYDNSDPANPVHVADFIHAQACDPVVVEGTTAYITLRDGSTCQNFTNQLDVVDISNIYNPQLLKSYPMHNPHGLAVRNDILYICDGDDGLKVYDAEDKYRIDENQLSHVKDINMFDAISLNPNHLLLIGADGFFQYNSADPANLQLLSHINIEK
jgi:hypothetical protein